MRLPSNTQTLRSKPHGPHKVARANDYEYRYSIFLLLSFVKVMELIFGVISWGRGGFSLPISGRLKSPLPMKEGQGIPLFMRSSVIITFLNSIRLIRRIGDPQTLSLKFLSLISIFRFLFYLRYSLQDYQVQIKSRFIKEWHFPQPPNHSRCQISPPFCNFPQRSLHPESPVQE